MKTKRSLVVLQYGSFKGGERLLLRIAQIARMEKESSQTAEHSKGCSMGLVEIARSEIMGLSIVSQMLSRKQRKNERRRSKSQALGQPGLYRKLEARKPRLECRTFREL